MNDVKAYPLKWPDGWPRSRKRKSGDKFVSISTEYISSTALTAARAIRRSRPVTFHRAFRLLQDSLKRIGAQTVIVSSNVPLKRDGAPFSDKGDRRLTDPGVALYFTLKGKPLVMAQDAYETVAANVRSLGLAIEHMRGLERHGGGVMMQKAFDGFLALPAPNGEKPKRPWRIVLNYGDGPDATLDVSVEEVDARYRTLAKRRHPDVDGGSAELFAELVQAREDALRELGG